MIDSAEDFAESILEGGSATVEGWGASASASFEVSSNMAFSQDSVTACLRRSYLSQVRDDFPGLDPLAVVSFTAWTGGLHVS